MIEKYQKMQFEAAGISHVVYFNGSGPPVVLMHESEAPSSCAGLYASIRVLALRRSVLLPPIGLLPASA